MELTDVAQRDKAEAALLRVGCGAPEQDGRPTRLTLPAPREGLVFVEEAAAELCHAAIGVSDMGLRGPTLDDVFLQLTGQAPTEDGTPQPSGDGTVRGQGLLRALRQSTATRPWPQRSL